MEQHYTQQLPRRGSRNRSYNKRRRSNYNRRMDRRGYEGMHAPEVPVENSHPQAAPSLPVEPTLKFFCQLAHGGPTAVIPAPNSLADVYESIASKFDGLKADDILYCTVNTFKPDMDSLLSSNLKLNDFIFAHTKGIKKEVTLTKSDCLLGVTLTDNGYGKIFIKRIHEDSVASRAQPAILSGDHIEKVNGQSVVGLRHYNVAAMLRSIPEGQNFTLRLVEPMKSGFSFIGPRSQTTNVSKNEKLEDGNQTLRFKSTGTAVLQEAPSKIVVDKINEIFETYLGFNDDVLALAGWEIAGKSENFVDLKSRIADSDLGGFGFPDELLFDMWGIVDDWRKNRIAFQNEKNSDESSGENDQTNKN